MYCDKMFSRGEIQPLEYLYNKDRFGKKVLRIPRRIVMLRTLGFGLIIFTFMLAHGFAQPNLPKPKFSSENYGSWSLVCPKTIGDETPCQISQVVANDPKGKKVILGISVYYFDSTDKSVITFRLSSIAVREAGIGLKIDNGDEFRLPINKCDKKVCIATGLMDENMLAKFCNGTFCQLAFILPNKKQMTVPVSLNGFENAFKNLKHKAQDKK